MSEQNWDNQIGGNHYRTTEGEQHWDMVVRLFGLEAARGYLVGCATKYLMRSHIKEDGKNELKDVDKAIHYLNKWKSVLENEAKKQHEIIYNTNNKFRNLSPEDLEKIKNSNIGLKNFVAETKPIILNVSPNEITLLEVGKFYKFNDPNFEGYKYILKILKVESIFNDTTVTYFFIKLNNKTNEITNYSEYTENLKRFRNIILEVPNNLEKAMLTSSLEGYYK